MNYPAPTLGKEWGHFLCRWDPATVTKECFWNGKLAATAKLPGGHAAKNGFFRVGNTHKKEAWIGTMDDVAIFDKALPDSAIPQAMLGNFAHKDAGVCVRASQIPVRTPPKSAAQMLDVELDLAKGVVVEATLQCSSNTTAGLVVRGPSGDTAFLVDCDRQHFLVGSTVWDRSPGFASNEALHLRLLLRSTPTGVVGMSEFYVNDIMCVLRSLRRAARLLNRLRGWAQEPPIPVEARGDDGEAGGDRHVRGRCADFRTQSMGHVALT